MRSTLSINRWLHTAFIINTTKLNFFIVAWFLHGSQVTLYNAYGKRCKHKIMQKKLLVCGCTTDESVFYVIIN